MLDEYKVKFKHRISLRSKSTFVDLSQYIFVFSVSGSCVINITDIHTGARYAGIFEIDSGAISMVLYNSYTASVLSRFHSLCRGFMH